VTFVVFVGTWVATQPKPRGAFENSEFVFEGRSIFGHKLNDSISTVRGPQEKDFACLHNRCNIVNKHCVSWSLIDNVFGLCLALDNVNDNLELLIQEGLVQQDYNSNSWLEKHYFAVTDVS
jgi:hypothetical protein